MIDDRLYSTINPPSKSTHLPLSFKVVAGELDSFVAVMIIGRRGGMFGFDSLFSMNEYMVGGREEMNTKSYRDDERRKKDYTQYMIKKVRWRI